MATTPPPPQARSISISEPSGSSGSPLTPGANDSATRMDTITEHVEAQHTTRSRAKSVPSLSFVVGKGKEKQVTSSPSPSVVSLGRQSPGLRPRTTSPPPPVKFQDRVSFDLMKNEDPTPTNTISFTLNVKHEGYAYKRRSRTFMVGIDDNPYSDSALQWLLEELVDDGDQIVCLRVLDRDAKILSDRALEKKEYQDEARACMEGIKQRNDEHRAINIILEFAVGKLNTVFVRMIEIYEPAMLIVGTRGRSLGGFQGLVANRNSFSRWCLQYSPVPVVVVRPMDKRMKKKKKRGENPTRQDYARMLRESGITNHETEVTPNVKLFEAANDPDAEAHAVAAVLGLPPQFDPPSKSLDLPGSTPLRKVHSGDTNATETTASRSPSPALYRKEAGATDAGADAESGEESGGDSSEDEFEAIPGEMLLNAEQEAEKKRKLHDMEVGEAAALAAAATRKDSIGSESSSSSVRPLGDVGEAALLAAAARKSSIGSQSSVGSLAAAVAATTNPPPPTAPAEEVQEEDAGNVTDTTVKPEASEG